MKREKHARLQKKLRKFGVTRTTNVRYADEPAKLDLFRVSLTIRFSAVAR